MANMNRRLKKAEKKLNLDGKRIIVKITAVSDEGFNLSNPHDQWLTYPEALERAPERNGVIVLHEYAEIEARRTAKLSNKEKKSNEYQRQD